MRMRSWLITCVLFCGIICTADVSMAAEMSVKDGAKMSVKKRHLVCPIGERPCHYFCQPVDVPCDAKR